MVRGWKKRWIPGDAGVGQASREVIDGKVAKDPACSGVLKTLRGWKQEGLAFCEWFAFAVEPVGM